MPVRYAVLLHDLGKGTTPLSDLPRHPGHEARSVGLVETVSARLRVPAECRDLARLVARYHGDIRRGRELRASTVVRLLERVDAFRRPARFDQLLQACDCDFHGRLGWRDKPIPEADFFRQALAVAQAVDAGAIARACVEPGQIAERINLARVAAVAAISQRP